MGGPVGWAAAGGVLIGLLLSGAGQIISELSNSKGPNGGWKDAMETQKDTTQHLGVSDARIMNELSQEDIDKYKDQVTNLTKILDSHIARKGPLAGLALNLKTQLLGMDEERLSHVRNLPTPEELETLLATNELMTKFYVKKENMGPTYKDVPTEDQKRNHQNKRKRQQTTTERTTIQPEELLVNEYTNDYMGFDKLYAMYSSLRKNIEEKGYMDQFASGQFDDDKYTEYQTKINQEAKRLGIDRNDGEHLSSFLHRIIERDHQMLEYTKAYMSTLDPKSAASQTFFGTLGDSAEAHKNLKRLRDEENDFANNSYDNSYSLKQLKMAEQDQLSVNFDQTQQSTFTPPSSSFTQY